MNKLNVLMCSIFLTASSVACIASEVSTANENSAHTTQLMKSDMLESNSPMESFYSDIELRELSEMESDKLKGGLILGPLTNNHYALLGIGYMAYSTATGINGWALKPLPTSGVGVLLDSWICKGATKAASGVLQMKQLAAIRADEVSVRGIDAGVGLISQFALPLMQGGCSMLAGYVYPPDPQKIEDVAKQSFNATTQFIRDVNLTDPIAGRKLLAEVQAEDAGMARNLLAAANYRRLLQPLKDEHFDIVETKKLCNYVLITAPFCHYRYAGLLANVRKRIAAKQKNLSDSLRLAVNQTIAYNYKLSKNHSGTSTDKARKSKVTYVLQ